MSRGPYPLMLMLAMSLPSTVRALGLGEIRVNSALNEPLSAQIDLVGATPQELLDLRAAIADHELFQRYGADRPAFLSSAKFKVGRDAMGRPVLNVRSEDPFTEPVVSLLVDLQWTHGEMVREYSLLLDPPNYAAADKNAEYASAPSGAPGQPAASDSAATAAARSPAQPGPAAIPYAPTAKVVSTNAAPSPASSVAHYRTSANDTLRSIARRAGARSEVDAQRLMIAIFRANPHAFGGNINLLHRGAELEIPSLAEAATITADDAKREVRAQMTAWQSEGKSLATHFSAAAVAAVTTPVLGTSALTGPPLHSASLAAPSLAAPTAVAPVTLGGRADTDALKGQVQSLEQDLNEMRQVLASQDARMIGIRRRMDQSPTAAASTSQQVVDTAARLVPTAAAAETAGHTAARMRTPAPDAGAADVSTSRRLGPFAAGLGVLVLGFAAFRHRRLRSLVVERTPESADGAADVSSPIAGAGAGAGVAPAPVPLQVKPGQPFVPTLVRASAPRSVADSNAPDLSVTMDGVRVDSLLSDANTTMTHVQMPSALNEQVVAAERRTNIVDVLKAALERDPKRHDLRVKLMEIYYGMASTNQKAFLELAKQISKDQVSAEDWNNVVAMTRQIAPGHDLDAGGAAGDELAFA